MTGISPASGLQLRIGEPLDLDGFETTANCTTYTQFTIREDCVAISLELRWKWEFALRVLDESRKCLSVCVV
jgi:hypothetical protein